MEIRQISGKRNPANSLSHQLLSDALLRKGSVKDANARYVQRLRVALDASDEEIQPALHQLFNQGPQGHKNLPTNQDQTPRGNSFQEIKSSVIVATCISKLQLNDSL